MLKFGDWINRKRHNRGFGIQSPSTFFFITQVLKERLPYYAYNDIERAAKEYRHSGIRDPYELFRITNYLHTGNCIAIASPLAACTMTLAHPFAKQYLVTNEANALPQTRSILDKNNCKRLVGDTVALLQAVVKETGGIGTLYIGNCDKRDKILATALEHTNNKSVIIVEGIHRDKATLDWWNTIVASDSTIVTYDMYSYGMLFFDKERKKQHYTLKR